tara:strand:- start:209 stop:445 length:237 start_codon:yes stop_codon:yes gene_type:complete
MEEDYTREKLSKQSIRGNVSINMNGTIIDDKDILIRESQTWADKDIIFFKKMLKQGGKFSISGRKFFVIPNEDSRSLI